jgi:hypothetical protein
MSMIRNLLRWRWSGRQLGESFHLPSSAWNKWTMRRQRLFPRERRAAVAALKPWIDPQASLASLIVDTLAATCVFFYFCILQKKIYRNIFLISGFTVLYPYRPAGGGRGPTVRQGGGSYLYVNKNKFILRRGPWREPAARWGGRGPAAQQGGGRLPPQI